MMKILCMLQIKLSILVLVLVHMVETTAANVHDSNKVVDLLQGTEEEVYGDSGYLGAEKKEDAILVNDKRIICGNTLETGKQ